MQGLSAPAHPSERRARRGTAIAKALTCVCSLHTTKRRFERVMNMLRARMIRFLALVAMTCIAMRGAVRATASFAYSSPSTADPTAPFTVTLTVTTDRTTTATVAARLTYDATRLNAPAAADVVKGAGIPASWSFAFRDVGTAGQIDFVLTDQTSAAAVISAASFEALKITFTRKAPPSCAAVTFGFNATRPADGTPAGNAFPDANQYIHYTASSAVQTDIVDASRQTPGTGTVVDHTFIRGNVNARSAHVLNISDAIDLANMLFSGLAAIPCEAAMDVNNDGKRNITDLVTLVHGVFNSTNVTIPPPRSAPGVVVPDGGTIASHLGCSIGETCP